MRLLVALEPSFIGILLAEYYGVVGLACVRGSFLLQTTRILPAATDGQRTVR